MTSRCVQCEGELERGVRYCGACGSEQPATSRPRLYIDAAALERFEVDSRCLLLFKLENAGGGALANPRLTAAIAGGGTLDAGVLSAIAPGRAEEVSLWWTPTQKGAFELSGELACDGGTFRFDEVRFQVGAPAGQTIVNIDQSSARVVDNSRSTFGAGPAGGLISDEQWHEIPLAEGPAMASFTIATRLSEYTARRVLATGDLSTVYLGDTTASGLPLQDQATLEPATRRVVIKVLNHAEDTDLMQDELRMLQRFRREEGTQVKHLPVLVDEFRTADGRMGLVLEHIADAFDLHAIRQRHPAGISGQHASWIMRRCLSALGFIHSKGILHCNLEPTHIMVSPADHNVFLLDWSYAVADPARTGQGFKAQNESFSPPEVAERRPPIPPSDLYSLALCIVYILGGDVATRTVPDSVDERFARFLEFFLRASPLQRPRDAWEMYERLDTLRKEMYGAHQFVEFEM